MPNNSPNLLELLQKDEGIQKLMSNAVEASKGAARGLSTDTLGAPVDLVNALLLGAGGSAPVGGSAWLRDKTGQPTEDKGAALAGNLASSLVSPEKLIGLLGVMIGKGSRLWDEKKAMDFLANEDKKSAELLWQDHGTARSPTDGLLRQEVPDSAMTLRSPIEDYIRLGIENKSTRLDNVIDHPELFKAYPNLKGVRVRFDNESTGASFNSKSGNLTIGTKLSLRDNALIKHANVSPSDLRRQNIMQSIVHEVQHSIQNKEGFQSGANDSRIAQRLNSDYQIKYGQEPDASTKALLEDIAFSQYKRVGGEAEARMVEDRMSYSPDVLREAFPYVEGSAGLDLDPKDLISPIEAFNVPLKSGKP